MTTSDTILLERWIQQRDAQAFNELVHRYSAMVYATCRRILKNPQDAEDVAQDCFVTLTEAPSKAQNVRYLGPWLHRIATRRALDRLRSEQRRANREHRFAKSHEQTVELMWSDIQEYVDEAIAALPEKLQTPVVAHFLQGKTQEAIAKSTGISRSTLTSRIAKGIEEVRKNLKRKGIPVAGMALGTMLKTGAHAAVPASLTSALGKFALAGTKSAARPVAVGGGTGKLVFTGSMVLLVALCLGLWFWRGMGKPVATQPMNAPVGYNMEGKAPDAEKAMPVADGLPAKKKNPLGFLAGIFDKQNSNTDTEKVQGSISGRVYDAKTGRGIPGVTLKVYPVGGGTYLDTSGRSDTNGNYTLPDVPDGSWMVSSGDVKGYPRAFGPKSVQTEVSVDKPARGVDFALDPGIPIAGKVVSGSGRPVPKAIIRVCPADDPNPERAKSESDGTFITYITRPTPKLAFIAYTDVLESEFLQDFPVGEEGVKNLNITLSIPKTASITGMVIDAEGNPLEKAQIHVNRKNVPLRLSSSFRADRFGNFKAARLAPGEYKISAYPPEMKRFSSADVIAEVSLTAGQQLMGLELQVGSSAGLKVSGRVVDTAGNPISGAEIRESRNWGNRALSKHDGVFVLAALEEGSHRLSVSHDQYSRESIVVVTGEQGVNVVLQGKGTVEGRVLEAETGKAIPDFEVSFINGAWKTYRPDLFANTKQVNNENGEYFITNINVGDTTVSVRAPGFAPVSQILHIKESETVPDFDFALKPAESFHGQVITENSEPVSDAFIFCAGLYGFSQVERQAMARTDAEGKFVLESFHPDMEVIGAWHPEYAASTINMKNEKTIVLSRGGRIEGIVTWEKEPLADCQVSVQYEKERGLPSVNVATDPQGRFVFEGVSPGQGTVFAYQFGKPTLKISQDFNLDDQAVLDTVLNFGFGTAIVEGVVTIEDVPLDFNSCYIKVKTSEGELSIQNNLDLDGSFRFENVPAGEATLHVTIVEKSNPYGPGYKQSIEFIIAPDQHITEDVIF